jgi:hypothetical protein
MAQRQQRREQRLGRSRYESDRVALTNHVPCLTMTQPIARSDTGDSCPFCDGPGPFTREHVVAQWISETLTQMEPDEPDWWTHYSAGGILTRNREHPSPNPGPTVVVRAVCGTCNSGWMSDVEGTARPVLEPMIRGKQVSLSAQRQLDVAAWAAKTAIALEHHEPTATITLREDRHLVREQLRPPQHHRVRLAYRDAYLEPLVVKTLVGRSDTAADERPDVFITLIALGFLLVHVWGGHGAPPSKGFTTTGTQLDRALTVWPPIIGTVVWPPRVPVNDEDMDDFTAEVAPWTDESPGVADWRAMRRVTGTT